MLRIVRRLLVDRWEFAALLLATLAVLSLGLKWWIYPYEHGAASLVHDVSIAAALVFSILGLYFRRRIVVFRTGHRPEWLRDEDTDIEWWPEGEGPERLR